MAFSYGHPFWPEALRMRSLPGGGQTIYEILKAAHAAGYTDLTYRQIAYGLRRAPQDAMLPHRSSRFLRERFAEASKRFNSYETMRDLAQEALAQVAEYEEELASPETTPLREQFLRGEIWRWYQKAFEWAEKCSDVALKIDAQGLGRAILQGVDEEGEEAQEEGNDLRRQRERIEAEQEALMAEFNKAIPAPPMEQLVTIYGGDNVALRASEEELDEYDEDDDEVV